MPRTPAGGAGLRIALVIGLVGSLSGCASPRPVLYPNAHLNRVGQAAAQADVDECIELAEAADLEDSRVAETAKQTAGGAVVGAAAGGAVGAIRGRPGTGAAAGAAGGGIAGFFRGLFGSREPEPVFKRYVDVCLSDRGYRPLGWK